MGKKFTSWSKFRTYIRTFNVGDLITRKSLIQDTDIKSNNTVDNFRRVLEKNNVITKMPQPGVYMLIHELPEDMTLNEMMLRAYGKKPQEIPHIEINEEMLRVSDGRNWGPYITYVHQPGVEPNPLYPSSNMSICDFL